MIQDLLWLCTCLGRRTTLSPSYNLLCFPTLLDRLVYNSTFTLTKPREVASMVWAVGVSGGENLIWSIDTLFDDNWNLATVTVPIDTDYIRFKALGRLAIDDVTHTTGGVCGALVCDTVSDVNCASRGFCMSSESLCDSYRQCPDTDILDEDLFQCNESCIFRCVADDRCLHDYSIMCDGFADCGDSSDESNELCRASPNCTFEYGICGYRTTEPRPNPSTWGWNVTRTDGDMYRMRGNVLTFVTPRHYKMRSANLASPKFPGIAEAQCLSFSWRWNMSSTRSRSSQSYSRLSVFSVAGSVTETQRQILVSDSLDMTFYRAAISLPPFTEQFTLQAYGRERSESFSVDNFTLVPGACPEDSVRCSFEDTAQLCGYTAFGGSNGWINVNQYNISHMTLKATAGNKAFLSSPMVRQQVMSGCVSFDYRIEGPYGGRLSMYVIGGETPPGRPQGEPVWTLTSSSHQTWRSVRVSLDNDGSDMYRIVFVGAVTGSPGNAMYMNDVIRLTNVNLQTASCSRPDCAPGYFSCGETYTCIPEAELCNSVTNCADNDLSDETNSLCNVTTVLPTV